MEDRRISMGCRAFRSDSNVEDVDKVGVFVLVKLEQFLADVFLNRALDALLKKGILFSSLVKADSDWNGIGVWVLGTGVDMTGGCKPMISMDAAMAYSLEFSVLKGGND